MSIVLLSLLSNIFWGQECNDFRPAGCLGSGISPADGAGRSLIGVKAPEATRVKLNFWSGPKVDMEKQPHGFWTVTTTPLKSSDRLRSDPSALLEQAFARRASLFKDGRGMG